MHCTLSATTQNGYKTYQHLKALEYDVADFYGLDVDKPLLDVQLRIFGENTETNATSEVIYIRSTTTTTQERLNHFMILHVHKEIIANNFN